MNIHNIYIYIYPHTYIYNTINIMQITNTTCNIHYINIELKDRITPQVNFFQ